MLLNSNDKNIKDLLKQVLKGNRKLDNGVSQVTIEEAWKDQMGPVISSYTERLYFSSGKLTVYLNSAPLRSELSMSKVKLIGMLNAACGDDYVSDIILK